MELGFYAVIGIAVIVAVAAFSKRLGVAAPIILVVVGVTLSYLPGVPSIEIPHEIVLDAVLPPILYAAAIRLPLADFRRDLAPIAGLSVVLVILTAFVSGWLLYTLLPQLSLPGAIALGAIISPPDAVAATSIGRRLGLPPRLLTLLEGEGLVNDATALVLLRTATAAAAGLLATPFAGVLDFAYATVAGIAVGLAAGLLSVYVRSKLSDPLLDTALSIAVPFAAFMPAEAIGGSGVLAVVVAGLYTGYASPKAFTAQARITDRINWGTIQFLLENAVFLVIGLEIRTLVEDVQKDDKLLGVWESVGIGLLALVVLIIIRFAWAIPLVWALRKRTERAERRTLHELLLVSYYRNHPVENVHQRRRKDIAERRYGRMRADLEAMREQQIDWRGGVVLGWSGMRGVVTLAAAQSLPGPEAGFPYRPQLILIAFTVAVVSLIVQGGTLPALIRLLKVEGADPDQDRRQLAALLDDISNAGLEVLDDPSLAAGTDEIIDPEVVERVRQSSFLRTEAAWERARLSAAPVNERPHLLYRTLRLAVVDAERTKLVEERRQGRYPSRIFEEAEAMLDVEETRLRPTRRGH